MSRDRCAIHGRVTTAQGEPIAGAAAIIEGGPAHPDVAALTDAGGRFRYDDLVPGTYTLSVHAEGYAPRRRSARLEEGQIANLDFTLVDENA